VQLWVKNREGLMKDTNRFEEAEPLMRRSLEILEIFRSQTGYEHPHFQMFKGNYTALQQAMKPDEPTRLDS